jgi:hypothetical protein
MASDLPLEKRGFISSASAPSYGSAPAGTTLAT